MRMGKKMRIVSILMSITVIAATLGFATYAITQNSTNVNYDGSLNISGNADIDVSVAFYEIGSGVAQFSITADENGIIEKQGDTEVNKVTDVANVTSYSIKTKPVLNPENSYKFVITINNPSPEKEGKAYVDAVISVVSFTATENFADYYTVVNPAVENNILKRGESVTYTIFINANDFNNELDYKNIDFSYNLTVVANKAN